MQVENLQYTSSVDGTAPLFEDVAFVPDGKPKPIIAVMHGYGGDSTSVAKDIADLAVRGLFCVAPDMRGRGKSRGRWDSGGLDVFDIVDGILSAALTYPEEIDRSNINVVGYSGGGGNCFAAMVRFPDLFHVVAPFFGISNYGLWYDTRGRPDCNEVMVATLGGTPEELPDVYAARNACLAAGNNGASRLHVFWDEEEKDCPPILYEEFLDAYHAAGHTNAITHISRVGDEFRWIHGYRTDNRALQQADSIFCEDIFARTPNFYLPPRGTLTVCGYLVTKHFQVFIEDGQRGVAEVTYDLTETTPLVTVRYNPFDLNINISCDTPLRILMHH